MFPLQSDLHNRSGPYSASNHHFIGVISDIGYRTISKNGSVYLLRLISFWTPFCAWKYRKIIFGWIKFTSASSCLLRRYAPSFNKFYYCIFGLCSYNVLINTNENLTLTYFISILMLCAASFSNFRFRIFQI